MDEMRRLLNIMENLAKKSGLLAHTLAKRFRQDMEDMMGDDAVDYQDRAGLRELIYDWIDNYEIELGDVDVDDLVYDIIDVLSPIS
jgi:hypothetical protein